ncbi:S8 family serine peptidase [Streptomyces sp. NPDC058548]|uniref:S8 family serine peptidase n=1 Tax=unclassified Streptomyces TaxID=2593676 RepID=UPI00364B2294
MNGGAASVGRRVAAGLLGGVLLLPTGTAVADPGDGTSTGSSAGSSAGSGTGSSAGSSTGSGTGSSAASGAGSDPSELPGITQTLTDVQRNGCRKRTTRTTPRLPWAQSHLRPDAVWPLTQGKGVTVAVVGSGVDDTSAVLKDRLTTLPRFFDGGRAVDCTGHGTFLAGLVAARRTDDQGFAGLAPQARIVAVGVTDQAGNTTAALLAKGIRAAVDKGADVVAVAVPVVVGSTDLAAAVRYGRGKGVLVVAPVSTDSTEPIRSYPASYPGVLAVAAIGPGGELKRDSGGGRVDLTAPGEAVLGTGPAGPGHFTASGPSYAAAFVAGTAALVLGYRPDLTGDRLADRLRATAYHPGGTLPDPRVGYGTVDPVAAVTAVLPGEQSEGPRPAREAARPLDLPASGQRSAAGGAYRVAGAALGVTALVALAAVVVPRGRRRGWRPAGR